MYIVPFGGSSIYKLWFIAVCPMLLLVMPPATMLADDDHAIPPALIEQLEDALAERMPDLEQRVQLVEQLDQVISVTADAPADSSLTELRHKVRFVEALTNMRSNKLELCAEQLRQLDNQLDAAQYPELAFRSRSLAAAVMLLRGQKKESLAALEELLAKDVRGIPELFVDRARVNYAVALERTGRLEDAALLYQEIMLTAIEKENDTAALHAGNNLLTILAQESEPRLVLQTLSVLEPVEKRNPNSVGAQAIYLQRMGALLAQGQPEAAFAGLQEFVDRSIAPPTALLAYAQRLLAGANHLNSDLKQAIVHAEEATRLEQESETEAMLTRLLLAELYLEAQDYDRFEEQLRSIGDPASLSAAQQSRYFWLKLDSEFRATSRPDIADALRQLRDLSQPRKNSFVGLAFKNFESKLEMLTKNLESRRQAALEVADAANVRADRYRRYAIYGLATVGTLATILILSTTLRHRAARWRLVQQQALNAQLESLVEAKVVQLQANLETEAKLTQALERKKRIETVGLLAGNIAHDVNNLLQVIGNAVLTLGDPSSSEQARADALAVSNDSLRHGAGIIRQILDYSHPQQPSQKPFRISDFLQNSRALFRSVLSKDVSLFMDDGGLDAFLDVDVSSLTTAMLNLLSNARDAMPQGGRVSIRVAALTLHCDRDTSPWSDIKAGTYAQISVEDTGTGIPPELMDRIFEPFFSTKGVGDGTGLGLSSVHTFVKQYGGDVRLESSSTGTGVHMLLPLKSPPSPSPQPPKLEAPVAPTTSRRLLLVEDNPAVAKSMGMLLTRLNLECTWASSADEAAVMLEHTTAYEIVLTDLHMPGSMDGIALAQLIKKKHPSIRVVLMSGYQDERGHEIGVPMLQKPFRLEQLKEILDNYSCHHPS